MAINFTDSPANGATQVVGGRTYTYNSAKNKWDTTATEVTTTVYSTIDDLPLSGVSAGAQAYVSGNNRLYIWNGTGWYNIALINTAPSIAGANSSYTLAIDGTPTTVTLTASDPEGLPVAYSIASDTSGNIATVTQGTGVNVNVFTITPSTNEANAGTFSLTFRASDGVNLATAVSEFTLQFKVQNSNYTTSLITTNGSTGQNTTFTDSSSSSHTVTAYGNVTQNSFSPYRSGGYSAYFDGNGDYLNIPYNATLVDWSSGDFTIEAWVYYNSFNVGGAGTPLIVRHGVAGAGTNYWSFGAKSTGALQFYYYNGAAVSTCVSTATLSLNQWHHIAMSYNNTNNEITLYLDGVSVHTHTVSGTPQTNTGSTLVIGELQGTEHNGYITDLRITGSEVYSSAFTPTTKRLTAITNTHLLACHLPYFADGSTNGHTITPNGNVSAKPFGPYDYQEYAVGDHGGSAYFDGAGDYIATTLNSNFSSKSYTIEGWFYPSVPLTGRYSLFNVGSGTSATDRITIGVYDGTFFHQHEVGNSNTITVLSGGIGNYTLAAGQWHHFEMVFDWGGAYDSTSTGYIFMNGVLQETYRLSAHVATSIVELSRSDIAGGAKYFPGYVSDFRVRQGTAAHTTNFTHPTAPLTAVTNTSLLLNMQGAVILDKSQTVTNIILSGATASTTQYKYLPSSIYFDGTNDYARADDAIQGITSTTPFTIEAWVHPTQIGTTGDRDYFFGINTLSAGGNILLIGVSNIGVNGSSDDTTDLSLNTWSHIAFVYDGNGGWKYYINGTLDYTHSDTITLDGSSFVIGAEADAANAGTLGNYFGGYLSDIRVTKGLQRYTANFTPPPAALQA